jgi:D-aminoacyl-tRNA deacylase
MLLVLQRVSEARVSVAGDTVGAISTGLLVLGGIGQGDTQADADYLVDRLVGLRIFPDAAGKMNLSVRDVGGSLLLVSQFTLLADCTRGRRPSFDRAAPPDVAAALWDYFVDAARRTGVPVETGAFQTSMRVSLVNEGPVTILINSADRGRK